MAFRADESARVGYEELESYLVPRPRDAGEEQRARSKQVLQELVRELGPVVDFYPTWHPLVSNHDGRNPVTVPGRGCGYAGLDHTRMFVNGFITCPYGDGKEVIDSVNAIPFHPIAHVTATKLDVQLYNPNATPILVKCHWHKELGAGGMIPVDIAVPLLLERELPCWRWSEVAETWESMRSYFLGGPHGSRSSLFVSQETGQAMKKVWETIIATGMFGPIKD